MYKVVSLMSGTSLDGVDIAFCEFRHSEGWTFELLNSVTIPYDENWYKRLSKADKLSGLDLTILNADYGVYLGMIVKKFCAENNIKADFISSHGHTVFHQPSLGITLQIGSGSHIAAVTENTVVCDFRTLDVALGGQGAPLVPIGDRHLFAGYDYCLNLGGIANISFEENGERKAYDVCVCNIALNYYAQKLGFAYDSGGELADKGNIDKKLLQQLSALEYYSKAYPKSLGREDIENNIFPLIDSFNLKVEDILATVTRHIADQIVHSFREKKRILITGGGAFNTHLIDIIANSAPLQIIIPSDEIINYKEAIIFGFLGVLRMEKQVNALQSVTGSKSDNSGGAIYYFEMKGR